jgi:signal transduction histidine kinase
VIEILAPAVVRVRADAEALATIVENLISNALKYGGQPPRVHVKVEVSGDRGVLVVSDHGPGLSGKESARVFDAFVRGRDEIVKQRPGVGLGLYLVAELTHALDGDVRASSGDQGGLAVRVELPLEPALEGGAP